MGDASKALTSAAAAVQTALYGHDAAARMGGGGGNNYDPGFQNIGGPDASQGVNMAQGQQAYVDPLAPLPESQPQQQAAVETPSVMLGTQNDQPQAPPQPVDNPYVPDTPKELATNQEDPIEVTGDDWHPRKMSPLAQIVDVFLHGMIRRHNQSADTKDALQGWQKDPVRSLNRLRQVNPDMMMKLDEHIAQVGADKALETARRVQTMNDSGKTIGNMLGGILNSTASREQKEKMYSRVLPSLQSYADKAGYPKDMFPPTYDEDQLGVLNATGITGYQQAEIAKGKETLKALADWRKLRGAQLGAALKNNIRHDMVNEREQARHNREMEAAADRAFEEKNKPPRIIKTPRGAMAVDETGNFGSIGKEHWVRIKPGQWRQVE